MGARVDRGRVVQCTIYWSPARLPLFFMIFLLFQSLYLAFQVEEYSPNSVVIREVIFLKVWFNFRRNFSKLKNVFSPQPTPSQIKQIEVAKPIHKQFPQTLAQDSGEAEWHSRAQTLFDFYYKKSSLT